MRRLVLLVTLCSACRAPAIELAPVDAAPDQRAETLACTAVRAPDGGLCDPRWDEDGDCIPDACDDCPNIPQDWAPSSLGDGTAGAACTPLSPFEGLTRRLAFQGFSHDDLAWIAPMPAFGGEELRFADGIATMGKLGGGEQLAIAPVSAGSRDLSVTAVLRLPSGGTAGVVLRTSATAPREGYVCALQTGTFALWITRCDTGGTCARHVLGGDAGVAGKPVPADVLVEEGFTMRMAVQTLSPSRVRLGCQLFPAPTRENVAGTLLSTASKYTVIVETDEVVLSGEPALSTFAAPLEILSVDVLTAR